MAKGISWLLINPRGAYGGRHEWSAQWEIYWLKGFFMKRIFPETVNLWLNYFLNSLPGPPRSRVIGNVWLIRFSFLASFKCLNVALASTTLMNEFHEWIRGGLCARSERNTITTKCVLQPKGFPFNTKSIFSVSFSFISYKRATCAWAVEQITCWREINFTFVENGKKRSSWKALHFNRKCIIIGLRRKRQIREQFHSIRRTFLCFSRAPLFRGTRISRNQLKQAPNENYCNWTWFSARSTRRMLWWLAWERAIKLPALVGGGRDRSH